MSEQPLMTPETQTPDPNNGGTGNTSSTNRRPRPTNRSSNLASMDNAKRGFDGKISELPVIGKSYEQRDTYEKLIEAVVDYAILNLEESDDLVKLLEKIV